MLQDMLQYKRRQSDSDVLRFYQVMKSHNRFFFKGKFVQGADICRLYLTIFLINVPGLLTYYFLLRFFWENYNFVILFPAILLQTTSNYFLIKVSSTDPGIIPKNNLYYFSKEYNLTDVPFFLRQYKTIRNDLIIGSHYLRLKFCNTCSVYRPPRASHCGICNNCVEKFDHHCPWVGTCIGKRNHHYFYKFLGSTSLYAIFIFSCVIGLLSLKLDPKETGETDTNTSMVDLLKQYPLALFLGIYSFLFFFFVGALFFYHTYLIFTNQTTNEQLKKMWFVRSGNPYKRNFLANLIYCCLFQKKKKFFKFNQVVEKELPHHLKNTGMNQNTMEKISIEGQKSENIDPNDSKEKNELALLELRILNRDFGLALSREVSVLATLS